MRNRNLHLIPTVFDGKCQILDFAMFWYTTRDKAHLISWCWEDQI